MYTFGWVDFSEKGPVSKQGCPVFKNNCFTEPQLCPSTSSLSLLSRQPYEVGDITSLVLQTWKLRLREWYTNQLALNLNFSPGCLTLKTVLLTTASKVFWVVAELNVLGLLGHCHWWNWLPHMTQLSIPFRFPFPKQLTAHSSFQQTGRKDFPVGETSCRCCYPTGLPFITLTFRGLLRPKG